MESRILGNRYELIEKIGGGGMALVYKAKCQLLNRYVAVKILRPEFTNDEEFVKRFRVEAQSAASLSHPNIVSIYDVGNDGDLHYIIMEYIDGITLKDYIIQKKVLPWKEAINIAIQICSAIEHAHRNHIIHRDIKPHNIMMTKDGIAKVTDFGIARAVSSSTITAAGSTIGSVHYFSPEQARGGYIDEKSDLYSIGIVLYEMVTGRLPFDGDTPVAVALKHLQAEPPPPVYINEDIPRGVNDIIMKAIQKEQSARYQSAPEMLEDLNRVLKDPEGDFAFFEDTGIHSCPTRRMDAIATDNIEEEDDSLGKKKKKEKKKSKKSDKLTYWLAGITSLIIILLLTYIIGSKIILPYFGFSSEEFVVDNYIGRTLEDARQDIPDTIGLDIKEEFSDTIPKGQIFDQFPEKGKTVKMQGKNQIQLTVSKGPEMVVVPDVRGYEPRKVELALTGLGLIYKQEEQFDDITPKGYVIKTEPGRNEEVKVGTEVIVYVSKGPEIVTTIVPNLIGLTQDQAKVALMESNLSVGKTYPEEGNYGNNTIINQNPTAGTEVNENTAVDIYFSDERIISVELKKPENKFYGDEVRVTVQIIPSTTGVLRTVLDQQISIDDLPRTLDLKVPISGTTEVRIFYDEVRFETITR